MSAQAIGDLVSLGIFLLLLLMYWWGD